MNIKKIAKIAYILLLLFAFVLTFAPLPAGTWMYWVVAILGIFVGIFGINNEKANSFIIAFIGIYFAFDIFSGLDFIGNYLSTFFSYLLFVMGPIVITMACYKLIALIKD